LSLTPEDAARLGGSDIAAILGLSPWATPLSVYARVVSALEGRYRPEPLTPAQRRGILLESAVLRMYEEETGFVIHEGCQMIAPKPFLRASVDAIASNSGNAHVVEVKTAGRSEAAKWGEPGTDVIPQQYVFQCTWYGGMALACDGADSAHVAVACLLAGDLAIYHVPYDAGLYEMLLGAAERFWVDHVVSRKPPPFSEPHADLGAISTLYPKHEGEARHWDSLPTEEQRAVAEWLRARKRRQEAEALEKAREAEIRMLLATTPEISGIPGELGGRRVTWKQSKSSKVTDWKRVAERLCAEMHVSPSQYDIIVQNNTTTKEGARPLVVRQKEET